MSSSKPLLRAGALALVMGASLGLAGCGMTPVYTQPTATQQALAMTFAAPNSPLEQIVYQDLTRRFGSSTSPNAAQVSVTVTTATRALSQSTSLNPGASTLLTATGVLRINRNGQHVLTASRQATATYTTDSQVIADNSAELAASEQATHALAQILELTIISSLTPSAPAAQ